MLNITETPPSSSNEAARVTVYAYDQAGQLTKITLPDGSEQNYVYNAAHELVEIYDNLNNSIEYRYDAKGNRTHERVIDPDDTLVRSTITQYDHRNFIQSINTDGSITQLINDAVGNLSEQTDPNDNPSTYHNFDALDRLTGTIDALSNNTGYQYNVADQLTQVTAPNGAITTYEFDDLGNQLSETSADRGTLTYQHDDAGNIISMTDARGIQTDYTYDALNRLTEINYPILGEDVIYTYETSSDAVNFDCGASVGQLCSVSDATGIHHYQFDVWGNVTKQTWISPSGTALTTQYGYDSVNRLIQIQYPSGLVIDYQRDAIGRVSAVHAPGTVKTEIIADGFKYRADGLIKEYRQGNAQIVTRNHDLQGRLTDQSMDGVEIANYTYDSNGNVVATTQESQQRAFQYDVLDRLENDDWVAGAIILSWEYDYDSNGNRISQIEDTNPARSLTYQPNSNQLSTIDNANVGMDDAGNITTLPRANGNLILEYNQQNHLKSVTNSNGTLTEYTYNNQRQRLIKQGNGAQSHYLYDLQGRIIATLDSNNVIHEEYIYANEFDFSPIHYRLYDDTEANTVEAQQALENSQQSIADPVNSSGQCQAYERTHKDRTDSDALTLNNAGANVAFGGNGGVSNP